jgi:hypothetical protein
MANYRRIATGNWTNLAQWEDDSGGSYAASSTLPGANDVVYANAFIITLDVDVTVLELRTTTATNVNAGGLFDFGTGSNVTANIIAGNSTCIRNNTVNTKNIIGNITATVNQGIGAVLQSDFAGGLNITGNCIGGGGFQCFAVWTIGTVNIVGNLTGGSSNNCAGIRMESSGNLNHIGIAEGGTSFVNPGIFINSNSTGVIRTSVLKSSDKSYAIWWPNNPWPVTSATIIVESTIDGPNGLPIGNVPIFYSNSNPKSATVISETLVSTTLVDPSTLSVPVESDVRDGVSYASGALTGTLKVPPTSSVAVGVPVDNTTGTAMISITDMGALLTSFKIA